MPPDLVYAVLGVKPKALCIEGEHSTNGTISPASPNPLLLIILDEMNHVSVEVLGQA